jgi:hypothetical protein
MRGADTHCTVLSAILGNADAEITPHFFKLSQRIEELIQT